MNSLRIFVDFMGPDHAMDLLRRGTAGHTLIFPRNPAASVLGKGERDSQIVDADVAFGQPDVQALADGWRLQWIHISSSGFTRYDTPEFRAMVARRRMVVSNSASVYSEPCAVHVLSFMLAQSRALFEAVRSHAPSGLPEWHRLRASCDTLRGQRVLILGYGAIGKRLVQLLAPFGMHVSAYRRRVRGDEEIRIIAGEALDSELSQTDHVINILPDNPESRGFFNAARFQSIKSGAVFYNIGRGATVDQDALHKAVSSGKLKAAWLDVTDPEPLPENHPLRKLPNCYITPHIAGGHAEEPENLVRHFLRNLEQFANGHELVDRIM